MRVFISLLQVGILGRSQGRVLAEYSSISQVHPLGLWSLVIGQSQGRGSLVIAAGTGITHLVLLLSGPGAEMQLRPICLSVGRISSTYLYRKHFFYGTSIKSCVTIFTCNTSVQSFQSKGDSQEVLLFTGMAPTVWNVIEGDKKNNQYRK